MQIKFGHIFYLSLSFITLCCTPKNSDKINRYDLVHRHNVHLEKADTLGSLSVGNGNFAYTMDITGMQTFPEDYENGIPLGTQSNWGWHTFPSDSNYTRDDVAANYETCNDKTVPYAIQHRSGRPANAARWLRANPHRLHLGIVGLVLLDEKGNEIELRDIEHPRQTLDLWTGKCVSDFEVGSIPVSIETVGHQQQDLISFKIKSPLIRSGRLKIKVRFPYGSSCHTCAGYNWNDPEKHSSEIVEKSPNDILIKRTLDTTNYFVAVAWSGEASMDQKEHETRSDDSQTGLMGKTSVAQKKPHYFEITPSNGRDSIDISFDFSQLLPGSSISSFEETENNSAESWEKFWMSGGAIDFSECTDPRASELERRVVLSQYLTKIQCSGNLPPQETGLTMNSWYGKFHMEMHWWHGVHFALWNRPEYLENTLGWYFDNIDKARETAEWQEYDGVRWQKMTSPDGRSSPSSVGEFLVWQQPHIIYFSELLYRSRPTDDILNKYKDLVFETADFMASFAQYNEDDGYYHLCSPLIPAQEHWKAMETSDPAFELSYWYWGLQTAQKWRERLGMSPNEQWQKVIGHLAPIPANNRYYLPTAEATDAYTNFEKKRDHPIVVGAYGFLPNARIDTAMMDRTFENVMREWNWPTTWGWDYPLLAMTATRLNKPGMAIDALFIDTQKNTYLVNGHNYQDGRLRLYLPGNGGLLTAVAMMAAGYEGCKIENPGFPKNGKWNVKWEGLAPMF